VNRAQNEKNVQQMEHPKTEVFVAERFLLETIISS